MRLRGLGKQRGDALSKPRDITHGEEGVYHDFYVDPKLPGSLKAFENTSRVPKDETTRQMLMIIGVATRRPCSGSMLT